MPFPFVDYKTWRRLKNKDFQKGSLSTFKSAMRSSITINTLKSSN